MDADSYIPSVSIFLTSARLNYRKLVSGIIGGPEKTPAEDGPLSCSLPVLPLVYQVPWQIENKYYTAAVHFNVLKENWPSHLEAVRHHTEAIIIYWDVTLQDPLSALDTIIENLEGFQPDEACLLVCDKLDGNSQINKTQATQWCIDNGWELIELEPPEEEEETSGLEDDFPESLSYDRIRGALNASQWSNIERKKQTGQKSKIAEKYSNTTPMLDTSSDPFVGYPETIGLEEYEENIPLDGNGTQSLDDFEALFTQFNELRITASTLPRIERLDYAEKVAKSFMQAMGLDEEDIGGSVTSVESAIGSQASEDPINASANKTDEVVGELTDKGTELNDEITSSSSNESDYQEVEFSLIDDDGELAKALGFPVLSKPVPASKENKVTCESQMLCESSSEEMPFVANGKSYEEIEEEFEREKVDKMLERIKEENIIRDECPSVDSDPSVTDSKKAKQS